MITFPMIPGIEINLLAVIFLSLAVGVISGFAGVGGGFIMTPALIILGFPANFAVGTSLMWVMSNSIVGTFRHRQLGNVDTKLGVFLTAGTVAGIEIGVRLLEYARSRGVTDIAVLAASVVILLGVGSYTLWESSRSKAELDEAIRSSYGKPDITKTSIPLLLRIKLPPVIYFGKSGISISFWPLLIMGIITGVLAGFMGVGGGIIIVPYMIYLFGVPSYTAVGTGLFLVVFSAAFGSIRHTMYGNVIIFATFIMILGSSVGVQFGALLTQYLRGLCMRIVLAATILIALLGAMLELTNLLLKEAASWLQYGTVAVTLGGIALVVVMVIGLFIAALRHRRGKHTPVWVASLIK